MENEKLKSRTPKFVGKESPKDPASFSYPDWTFREKKSWESERFQEVFASDSDSLSPGGDGFIKLGNQLGEYLYVLRTPGSGILRKFP